MQRGLEQHSSKHLQTFSSHEDRLAEDQRVI